VQALRCCSAFADLEFVVLAAMGTANIERDEAQSAVGRLVGFGALYPGIDLPPSRWTRKCKSAHGRNLPEQPHHAAVRFTQLWLIFA
jgi:hypothetical protein